MFITNAIIAGLIGTVGMTILMYLAPVMGLPKMDIINIIGTMFTSNKNTAIVIGVIIHFMMGAVFGLIYAFVWSIGIGAPMWLWGLIFGGVHGLVVAFMMPLVVKMHPRKPVMAGGTSQIFGLVMGHMVFGLIVAVTYAALLSMN